MGYNHPTLIGSQLSHFNITAKLGEGGMGEVYRAEDTKLGREVAIKVLPETVASDPERLARFEREAKVLASLNHPRIAAIYQVEEAEGVHFLVMELAEGEDLAQRLERGAIPVDESLPIALQIAEALEAAHERGIIHRDLKPANVKVTREGQVNVLDFGLAKAMDPGGDVEGVGANLSLSPTLTAQMTGAGVILGTAAYMSPEQARGKTVDKRADIWAFGVLLWEMLTGTRLFGGDTVTDVIAAVVTKDVDWDLVPPETPLPIRRVLSRCLRKDPLTRLPDIGAARLELQDVLDGSAAEVDWAPSGSAREVEIDRRPQTRERWMWASVASIASALAIAFAVLHFSDESEPTVATRFAIEAPEGWRSAETWPAPSPDGSEVLFQARRSEAISEAQAESYQRSGFLLWIRSFEAIDPRPLLGTESDSTITAFWSPDGRHIGFFADGKLRRYNLMDGTVQQICDNPGGFDFGADWNEAGQIIFATVPGGRIYVVPASGGDPKPIAELDTPPMGLGYHMPQFLPDGNRFLFSVESSEEEQSGLYLGSLDTPQEVRQIVSGRGGWALSAGHLLFVRDGSLFAQPFDAERAEVGGEPVVIAAPVITWTGNLDIGWFGTSRSETIAYLHGSGTPNRVQLAWVDRSGSLVGTVGEPGDYGQLTLAPDGRKVALEIRDEEGQYDLWIMDLARGVSSRLTATPEDERDPVWSPDSGAVAFMAKPRSSLGIGELRLKSLRAGGSETVLTDSADADIPESWSAQGATLFVVRQTQENEQSVWSISLQEDGEAERVLSTGFLVDEPHLSPDGGWLAYVSAESGRDEVYAEPYGRDGERVRVSVEGGGQPRWREDGQELFYVTLDGRLMSVNIEGSDQQLAVSLPQQLFEIANLQGTGYDDYAVSADGQRFLVKLPTEEEEGPEFHVVTNWTSLLQ